MSVVNQTSVRRNIVVGMDETLQCEVLYFLKLSSSSSLYLFLLNAAQDIKPGGHPAIYNRLQTSWKDQDQDAPAYLSTFFPLNFTVLFTLLSPPLISIYTPFPLSTTSSYFILIHARSSRTHKPVSPLIALDILIRNMPLLTHGLSLSLFYPHSQMKGLEKGNESEDVKALFIGPSNFP